MLNNHVGTVLVVHGFSESRLNLFGYVEIVEDGHLSVIEFYDFCFFGCNHLDIFPYLFVDGVIVDMDAVIGGVEQVAQHGHCPARFFAHQLWAFCCFLELGNGIVPFFYQSFELVVQFCHSFSFGRGTYYNAHVFGLDTLNQLL